MSRIPRSFVTPSSKCPIETSTPLEIGKQSIAKKFLPIKPPLNDITADKNILDVTAGKKVVKKVEPIKKPDLKRSAPSVIHAPPSKQIKVDNRVPPKVNKTAQINKIAPYDYKSKFNDLIEKHKVLRSENTELKDKFDECTEELISLKTTYEILCDQHSAIAKNFQDLSEEHDTIKHQLDELNKKYSLEKTLCEELKSKSEKYGGELEKLKEEYKSISGKLIETEVKLSSKITEYDVLKCSFEKEVQKCSQLSSMCEENQIKIVSQASEITFLNTRQKILEQRNEENTATIATLGEEKTQLFSQVTKLTEDIKQLKEQLDQKIKECDHLNTAYKTEMEKNSQLDSIVKENYKQMSSYQSDITSLSKSKEYLETKNKRDCEEKDDLHSENLKLKEIIANMYENQKVLRNEIQDLKGHIRVFCRIRPALTGETGKQLLNVDFVDSSTLEFDKSILNSVSGAMKKQKHSFSFDGIFPPTTSQVEVFEEVSSLIQSALDGYNVCIFAYGQTGSGKTYTMEGAEDATYKGIIPRAIDMMFSSLPHLQSMGWEFQITASFLEIYNENIYDLLDSSKDQEDHSIKMVDGKSNEVYVSNLKEEVVSDVATLMRLLHTSQRNRQTAATACNERSSRSHSVTKIKISACNEKRQQKYVSNLNLVDLAGSESAKTSQRMDETKSINKSLSELSKVILALQSKQSHIPYRNSKLTYLLMPSLGGNSKTLMLVNIPQFDDCYQETVNSLRFAAKVNSCRTGVAKKNISNM